MPFGFEPDLSFFLGDFGEPITWKGGNFLCLFDYQHDALSYGASGRSIEAIVLAEEFSGVSTGEVVQARLRHWTIAEIHPIQSGDFLRLILEEQ